MSARGRIPQRVYPGGHIGPPLRGGGGVPNQRKIGAKTGPCLRGGTEPAPYRRQEQNGCGGVRLGCGFRRPNFVPKFGASVMGIGPYALWGTARRGRRALRMVAESRRDCPGQRRTAERLRRGREGLVEVGAEITPEGAINAGQSLSQPAADSSLYTREPLGTGDADCRVASLLAMTVLILCHSEEAQRADVGIRPFYDGREFGPPYLGHGLRRPNFLPKFGASVRSSAPTESPINHPSQPARSEASAPAVARDGRESVQRPSQKGDRPATAQAALSEAESAERVAGQIQSLPDDLRVQHGVLGSEVSARPRPCSRRDCDN